MLTNLVSFYVLNDQCKRRMEDGYPYSTILFLYFYVTIVDVRA